MPNLPPLKSLRAFEVAARHLSFKDAAAELNVTAAAISQQIKSLEEFLGLSLFYRRVRSLELTASGRRLQPNLQSGFELIGAAVKELRDYETSGPLQIEASPAFAGKWLIPRLESFQRQHPEIELRVSADMRFADFAAGRVDCAIRFGAGEYEGLKSINLMSEAFFPVCSPALLKGPRPLEVPDDLAHHTLIHDGTVSGTQNLLPDWRMWLAAAGAHNVDPNRGIQLTPWNSVSVAVLAGQGVAIGRQRLVADDLAAGRLVHLFHFDVPTPFAHWLVYPPEHENRPRVQAFRDWIILEAEKSRADDLI